MVESQKDGVQRNYEGLWGFEPVVVSCAELKMPLAGLFRAGNASPMANRVGLLTRVIRRLQEAIPGIEITVRSDSAGYQAEMVRMCQQLGVAFTLTVRKDPAVLETIRGTSKDAWRVYASPAYPHKNTELAETVHAFGDKDVSAFRMIVLRWPQAQMNFMDADFYEYHAIAVSGEDQPAELALQFHRNRQDKSENMNKELIGGFGLSKLPCTKSRTSEGVERDGRTANAAYFQLAMLSQIVFVAFKLLALPEDWKYKTIETVRFEMIRLAGVVSRRARALWLKRPATYPYLKVFEEARWATMGAAAWVT